MTVSRTRGHLIDLTPLRESPAFARMWAGASITGIGNQMTILAVGLQIYDITESTLAVSFVGLFALVPMIIAGFYGGALADAFDRRSVAIIAAIAAWGSTAAIATLAWLEVQTIWPLYLLITLNTVASTMEGIARSAIIPRLLRPELLPAAGALNGLSFGAMLAIGPALAGVLVAAVGFSWTYTVDVVLFLAAFLGLWSLPPTRPEGGNRRAGLGSVLEGLRFLRTAPNIRAGFVLDLFAMTFGNPRVLFPAIGAVLIGGGAITVGVLAAAGAIGPILLGLFSGRLGGVRRQGTAIAVAVAAYGASILAFGVVLFVAALTPRGDETNVVALVLASAALIAAGASDSVSAIYRTTMLQAAVPDGMRGRLQGIFIVVVTGGPRFGDLYIGLLSVAAVLWFPPLLGGLVIVAAALIALRVQRTLRDYDSLAPTP